MGEIRSVYVMSYNKYMLMYKLWIGDHPKPIDQADHIYNAWTLLDSYYAIINIHPVYYHKRRKESINLEKYQKINKRIFLFYSSYKINMIKQKQKKVVGWRWKHKYENQN